MSQAQKSICIFIISFLCRDSNSFAFSFHYRRLQQPVSALLLLRFFRKVCNYLIRFFLANGLNALSITCSVIKVLSHWFVSVPLTVFIVSFRFWNVNMFLELFFLFSECFCAIKKHCQLMNNALLCPITIRKNENRMIFTSHNRSHFFKF